MRPTPKTSRRQLLGGFAGFSLAALPFPASSEERASAAAEARAAVFAAALDGLVLPVQPSRVTLARYEEKRTKTGITIHAVIHLTWPPGERFRPIAFQAADLDNDLPAILAQVEALLGVSG